MLVVKTTTQKGVGKMICPKCYGVGRIPFGEEPEIFSEEEWLRQATTEQLAEFINDVSKKCYTCGEGYTAHPAYCPFHKCLRGSVYGITEWLKQPHTNKE